MASGAIDYSKLTLGEVAKLEELSGLSLDKLAEDGTPKGKLLAAMAYVASRRRGAPISFTEALELTVEQADELLGASAISAQAPGAGEDGTEAGEDGEPVNP